MKWMWQIAFAIFAALNTWNVATAQQVVVVVLDDSGSMGDTMQSSGGSVARMTAAKNALREVLSSLPPDTQVGVLALNTTVSDSPWIVPIGPVGSRDLSRSIENVRAQGGTPLGASLKVAADELLRLRGNQNYGTYRLLIVSDGEANDPELLEAYMNQTLARGLRADVIGVDMKSDHSLATRVHSYRRADDAGALRAAIADVFAETSLDDGTAQDDFALIASLPDEIAAAAVKALATPSNEVLREPTALELRSSAAVGTVNVGGAAIGGLVCCGGVGLGLIVLISVLIRVAKQRG